MTTIPTIPTIKIVQKKDKQDVIFPFTVPDDGFWHTYFDPEIGAYINHCHRDQKNGTVFLGLSFSKNEYKEDDHHHRVQFDIELNGEWEYDYDEFGEYVPHIGWLYEKEGKICHFTAHKKHENAILLDGGKFLINDFGKYKPNLTFITKKPWIQWEKMDKKALNLPKGDISVIYGRFFTSKKKGTQCFDTTGKTDDVLIRDSWGGAFNDYRGGTLPEKEALYYREAYSHGGVWGNDYAIYPKTWRYRINIEEI